MTAPGGFTVQREAGILVRPARPAISEVTGGELAAGAETRLDPALDRMVAGTARATAGFGSAVRFDVAALVRALDAYELSCLEQAASKGLPLAVLPDGAAAGTDRAAKLQAAIAIVLDKQRFDGGFGLWSANGEAETWLSAYATEFLLRARTARAGVPDVAVNDAVKFLSEGFDNLPSTPEGYASQAYYLYVLAMAGQPKAGANRILAEDLSKLPTPLSRAQLGAALALSNDRPRAEAAFAAALAAPARRDWDADRGSALRDQVAVAALLKESGLLADRLGGLLARLPGADLKPDLLSTQEQAWAAAAGAVLGRDGRPVQVALDGRTQPVAAAVQVAVNAPLTARNLGDRPIYGTVSTTGVPTEPPAAARNQMRISRKFFSTSGDALNLDALKQNTVFILLIEAGRMTRRTTAP